CGLPCRAPTATMALSAMVDAAARVKCAKPDIPISTPAWRVGTPWRRMVEAQQQWASVPVARQLLPRIHKVGPDVDGPCRSIDGKAEARASGRPGATSRHCGDPDRDLKLTDRVPARVRGGGGERSPPLRLL